MLTEDELKSIMPLIGVGAKKLRRKLGELGFAVQFPALAGALVKLEQMAADAAKADAP